MSERTTEVTTTLRMFAPEDHRIRVIINPFDKHGIRLFAQGFDGSSSCGISEFVLTADQAVDLANHLLKAAELQMDDAGGKR